MKSKTFLFVLWLSLGGALNALAQSKTAPLTELEKRSGHGRAPTGQQARFTLPDTIKLEDGLSEDEAVAVALWNNAQLHADLSVLGLARADLIDAGLLRNPMLQLVLPIGPYRQFEGLFNFPLEVFWQRRRRVAVAQAELQRIAVGLEQNALNLMRDVRLAYAEWLLANDRARNATEAVQVREQIVRLTKVRLRLGDVSEIEATAAQLDEALANERATRFTREIVTARDRLRALLGAADETALPDALKPEATTAQTAALRYEALQAAAATRPELQAAALAIESAAARAKWEHSRLVTLAGLLNLKQGEGVPFSPRPGILAELPVFNRNQGGIARADAEVERAAWQFLAVRQRIAGETREAWNQYEQAQAALAQWQTQTLPLAEENVRLAERVFAKGDQSFLFVLDATRQFVEVRQRVAELQTDLRRALIQLDRSAGQSRWRNENAKP
ncbi:MAG: TolC family protein [Acidobacteria bacterium]|nr:TolC family protein [Acidobacteriota bacterium]